MKANYIPTIGDKINVSHPNALYCDRIKGHVFTQDYKVEAIDKNNPYGIKLSSVRDGETIFTEVEENWFNTQLTGRIVNKLN